VTWCGAVEVLTVGTRLKGLDKLSITFLSSNGNHWWTTCWSMFLKLFSLSMMMRQNKLLRLTLASLEESILQY
jgi:hypothetical protein